MSSSERPGVYTSYQVTSVLAGKSGGGAVGLAACAAAGTVGQAVTLRSWSQAVSAFGEDCSLTRLVKVLLLNGAGSVIAVPVLVGSGTATTAAYSAAFAVLMGQSAVRYMVCDSRDAAVHGAMKTAIASAASENSKYRVGFAEMSGTASALCAAAASLNCERMVLTAPAEHPALPLNGAVLSGLSALSGSFTDEDITALVQGGVTPVETVGGEISVVRAVTTRTLTAGVADATWRELTTILIVDDVIPAVRDALRARFARVKNTPQTRGAIRSQVVVELEKKLAAGIIGAYGSVSAEANAADAAVCDVSFAFTVAHGLNQISLVANITI